MLTAEQNLYQAQNNLAVAEGNVSVSLTTTYRALGGGWQIREGKEFVDDANRRRNARAHQLGRRAAARGPTATADARTSRPVRHRPDREAAAMVNAIKNFPNFSARTAALAALSLFVALPAPLSLAPAQAAEPYSGDASGRRRRFPSSCPKVETVNETLTATGNAEAVAQVMLVARVPGYLEKIHFEDGAIVKKGDLLFTIQQDQYKAQLQQAQAQLEAAKVARDHAHLEVGRFTALLGKHATSQVEVDHWVYEEKSAEANIWGRRRRSRSPG